MATTTTPEPYRVPREQRGVPAPPDAEVERARRLATILDRYFVDPILGFVIPGAGDVIGSVLGLYTVVLAVRRRVSPVIVARMLSNLAVDAALGIVPLVGDLFDLGHRAHTKNAVLLAERAEHGGRATARDWIAVIGAALAFVLAMGLAIYAAIALVRRLR